MNKRQRKKAVKKWIINSANDLSISTKQFLKIFKPVGEGYEIVRPKEANDG